MYWVSKWGLFGQESYFTGPSNGCPGDSGGPVFMPVGNKSMIAGITIRVGLYHRGFDCFANDTITTNLAHPAVRDWLRVASNGALKI